MIDLIKADADKAFDNLDFADEVDGIQDLKVGSSKDGEPLNGYE